MKNRIALVALVAMMAFSTDASAFGRRNHATVAYIAEQYLTPSARKAVQEIYRGMSLAEYACYPDDHRLDILIPLEEGEYMAGEDGPVLKGPDGKAFTYGTSFFTMDDGSVWSTVAHGWLSDEDFNVVSVAKGECIWAIHKYADELRHWQDLSHEEAVLALQMIVHMVGDMHCPSHVHFTDARDRNDLKYPVIYAGKEIRYHNIWDTDILVDRYPGGMVDFGYYCDPGINGSLSRKDAARLRKSIQAGTVEDWAHDVASRVGIAFEPEPGSKITKSQLDVYSAIGRDLVMRAGYRLAAVLNEIF